MWVELLRVNDDAAGGAYPIADGWVTGVGGKQPPVSILAVFPEFLSYGLGNV